MAEIAQRIGISSHEVEKILETNEIKPRYLIDNKTDNKTKYAPEDLGEIMTLLRSSVQPQNQAILLRAAQENPHAPQTLLRPFDADQTKA